MKKMHAIALLCSLTVVLLVAGCASPTTNSTANVQNLSTSLDAQLSAHNKLVVNFTRISKVNEAPVYAGTLQDKNGTLHRLTLYVANSMANAQAQFAAQKAFYSHSPAQRNATVTANSSTYPANVSTHWASTTANTTVNVWVVEPNVAGPFGLSVDAPYVLVSLDLKPTRQ
jgi:hypothetical protein